MKKVSTFIKIGLSIMSIFFLGLLPLHAQGDMCDNPDVLLEVIPNSGFSDANSIYRSAGQSITIPAGVTEIEAIGVGLSFMRADDFTLNLYSGAAVANAAIGSPIASKTITIDSDVSPSGPVYFVFDSPVLVTPGAPYYFLVDPSYDVNEVNSARYGYRVQNPGQYAGGAALSGFSSGNLATWNYDLAFQIVSCLPSCSISNPAVVTDDACDGDNATFTLSFDAVSGSGDYDIIASADNTELGLTNGEVLGSIRGGATDGTGIEIIGTVPSTTAGATISVGIVDATTSTCTVPSSIPVTIAACVSTEPLPAMNRWGLILFSMIMLGAGLLAYRRF